MPEILGCKEFVNADEIARGLSPFNPESVAIEAGKLMLQRIKDLLARDESFSIETTLATRSYVNLVRKAQDRGYSVSLLYFWLDSPELAMRRVAERVSKGGHDIPKQTIRRRYVAGIKNLFLLFMPVVNFWAIYDNSGIDRVKIATGRLGEEMNVSNHELLNKICDYVR